MKVLAKYSANCAITFEIKKISFSLKENNFPLQIFSGKSFWKLTCFLSLTRVHFALFFVHVSFNIRFTGFFLKKYDSSLTSDFFLDFLFVYLHHFFFLGLSFLSTFITLPSIFVMCLHHFSLSKIVFLEVFVCYGVLFGNCSVALFSRSSCLFCLSVEKSNPL